MPFIRIYWYIVWFRNALEAVDTGCNMDEISRRSTHLSYTSTELLVEEVVIPSGICFGSAVVSKKAKFINKEVRRKPMNLNQFRFKVRMFMVSTLQMPAKF